MTSSSKCSICSAPTTSLRYGAQACNVCANFFRRNVLNKRDGLLCSSGGLLESQKCFADRECATCRLDLCVRAGMSQGAVVHNAEYRRGTKERQKGENVDMSDDEKKQIIVRNPTVPEQVVDRVILNLNQIEVAFNRLRKSKFNPLPGSVRSLKEALSGSCKLSIDYGVEHWSLSYPAGYKNDEGTLLENVFRRIKFGLERENYEDNRKSWNFANEKTHLVFPDGLALCAGMERNFEQVIKSEEDWIQYVKNMNLDKNECALLKILLILSPSLDDASTNERALLTSHSESYAKILFSYVMASRGNERGPRSFQEMLALVESINRRVKLEKDVYIFAIGMFKDLCPILAEIITI